MVVLTEGRHLDVPAFGEDYGENFATNGIAGCKIRIMATSTRCSKLPKEAGTRFNSKFY